jgi:hypothetical protein
MWMVLLAAALPILAGLLTLRLRLGPPDSDSPRRSDFETGVSNQFRF